MTEIALRAEQSCQINYNSDLLRFRCSPAALLRETGWRNKSKYRSEDLPPKSVPPPKVWFSVSPHMTLHPQLLDTFTEVLKLPQPHGGNKDSVYLQGNGANLLLEMLYTKSDIMKSLAEP